MLNVAGNGRFRKLPPARTCYERELGELRREDPRGWARSKAGCPFHASESKTSFPVNLRTGGFCCFGCEASGGDIVAFMMRRYGLMFKIAAQRLGAWDAALRLDAVVIHQLESPWRQAQEKQAAPERQHRERIRARDCLHCCERLYRETSAQLGVLRHQGAEVEVLWANLALLMDEVRDAEAAYLELAGLR